MAKLLDKNAAELAAALVDISGAVRRFLDDAEFKAAFEEATKDGVKRSKTDLADIYSNIIPMLFGEEHLRDTISILACIEGKNVQEMLEMNGTDLVADALQAWKEQIVPFFLRLGVTAGKKPSKSSRSTR